MSQPIDLLAALADIDPASELALARNERHAATQHTPKAAMVAVCMAIRMMRTFRYNGGCAMRCCRHKTRLFDQQQVNNKAHDARFAAGHAFAELLSLHPVDAAPKHIQNLQSAGWTPRGIVTLAQLIAFVSFQSRLLTGLRLLNGEQSDVQAHAVAGKWHDAPLTLSGQTALTAFTQQELGWEPWLAAKPLHEFTADEQATLKKKWAASDLITLSAITSSAAAGTAYADRQGHLYTAGGLPRVPSVNWATVGFRK
ncbi:hypothetical protein LZ023_38070 (plasmid) [Pseudomonas silvicola]|nr:hypothetical protein LZ023_38070 [Pseudomonas silvicola]